jgi:hypothetical protein
LNAAERLCDTLPPAKTCACGSQFSEETWAKLVVVGAGPWLFDEGPSLDVRVCDTCDSSLARELV